MFFNRRLAVFMAATCMAVSVAGCEPIQQGASKPGTPEVVFEIRSSPPGLLASIHIDATYPDGSPVLNADTGMPYPMDVGRRTPYKHTFAYEPGAYAVLKVVAIVVGEPGDVVSCSITDDGFTIERPQPKPVAEIPPGVMGAEVVCIYTTK